MKARNSFLFLLAVGVLAVTPLGAAAQYGSPGQSGQTPSRGSEPYGQAKKDDTAVTFKVSSAEQSSNTLKLSATGQELSKFKAGQQVTLQLHSNSTPAAAPGGKTISGTISSIDEKNKTMTLRVMGADWATLKTGATVALKASASSTSPASGQQGLRNQGAPSSAPPAPSAAPSTPSPSPSPSQPPAQRFAPGSSSGSLMIRQFAAQGSSSSGQQSSQYPSPSASMQSQQQIFSGTIVSLDSATKAVELRMPNGEQKKFTLDADTKYNLDKSGATFSDLKEGQQITIMAKGDDVLSVRSFAGADAGRLSGQSQSDVQGLRNPSPGGASAAPAPTQAPAPDRGRVNQGVNPYGSAPSSGAAGAMTQTRPLPSTPPSSTASAQSSTPSAQAGSSQASGSSATAMEKKYSGTVTEVDERGGSLTIKTAGGDTMKFLVDTSTKINFAGAAGKLSGLKAGNQISVSAKADKAVSIDEFAMSSPMQ